MTRHDIRQLPVILSPSQVRALLNIGESTYRKLIMTGTLRPIYIGNMRAARFLKHEILAQVGLSE